MQKILAIKLRAIGDTVIWTAALQALRNQFPEAEIHTLTYAANAAVLLRHSAVHKQHYLQTRSHLELLKTLWSLRMHKFSHVLGFHATTSLCRWAWLVGGQTLALHHHSWSYTPRGSVPITNPGRLEDAIARDLRVVEAVGSGVERSATRICLSPEETDRAESEVRSAITACGGNAGLPRFAFLPGAGHHLRRYPKEKWLPLAEEMLPVGKFQPIVVVDEALSRELGLREDCAARRLPLLDHGDLRQFMGRVSRAKRALANDSGPGHIAVALGVRTSFVFGPGCVGDWHPYSRVEHPLFRLAVPCRAQGPRDREEFQFCTLNECSHHRCLRELPVLLP